MGLWQTGYLDKLDTGYDGYTFTPKPVVYTCAQCSLQFNNKDELLEHRFQDHPYARPTLFFMGNELPSFRKIISREIKPDDFFTANCEYVLVDDCQLHVSKLGANLCQVKRGIKRIILFNNDISSEYEINFKIPEQHDLADIDRRFFEFTKSGVLDRKSIDDFIESAGRFQSATNYLDGLAQYMYGVLAKDQKGNSGLPIEQYKEKYNQALDSLHDYETYLARIICGVIDYNFNVFVSYPSLSMAPILQQSMCFFEKMLSGSYQMAAEINVLNVPSGDKVPLDSYTDKIIAWSLNAGERTENLNQVDAVLHRGQFTPEDQVKLRIIAVSYALRYDNKGKARELVRPMVNDAVYGEWAAKLLESTV